MLLFCNDSKRSRMRMEGKEGERDKGKERERGRKVVSSIILVITLLLVQ